MAVIQIEEEEVAVNPIQIDEEEQQPIYSYNKDLIINDLEDGVMPFDIINDIAKTSPVVYLDDGSPFDVRGAMQSKDVAVEDIIGVLKRGKHFDDKRGGLGSFTGGINKGIADFFGMPGNLAQGAINLGISGYNALTGSDVSRLKDSPFTTGGIKKELDYEGIPVINNMDDVLPSEKASATVGEVIGAGTSTLLGMGPLGQGVKQGTGVISKYLKPITDPLLKKPGATASTETLATGAAAVAAGTSQKIFPDNEYAQLFSELVGGTVGPSAIDAGVSTVKNFGKGFVRFINNFQGEEGARRNAVMALQDAIKKLPPNPDGTKVTGEEIAKLLDKAEVVGGLTSAQKSKNEFLIGLENELASRKPSFSKYRDDTMTDSLEAVRYAITQIASTGDVNDLKVAAQLEEIYFKDMITKTLNDAKGTQKTSSDELSGANSKRASTDTANTLNQAISALRGAEDKLWGAIPRTVVANTGRTQSAIKEMQGEFFSDLGEPGLENYILEFRKLAKDPEYLVNKQKEKGSATQSDIDESIQTEQEVFGSSTRNADDLEGTETPTEITVDYMIKLRKRMLEQARVLRGGVAPNSEAARRYSKIAEAILEDLGNLGRTKNGKVVNEENAEALEAILRAKNFSRDLQDAVLQTDIVSILRRTDATGSRVTAKNKLLEEGFQGTEIDIENISKQMDDITDMANQRASGELADLDIEVPLDVTPQMQEQLQSIIFRTKVKADGSVDADAMNLWVRNNSDLLEKFPVLQAKIRNAAGDQQKLNEVVRQIELDKKAFYDEEAIGKLLKYDDPARAVEQILSGNKAETGINRLMNLVNAPDGSNASAIRGLKASVIEGIKRKATDNTGKVNLLEISNTLQSPLVAQGDSILKKLVDNGIMDIKEADRLKVLLDESAQLIEIAKNANKLDDEILGDVNALFDLMTRVGGATLGSFGVAGAGAPLVAAQAGSETMRKIVQKIPGGKVIDTLVEAAKDPKIMSDLLNKTKVPQERAEITRRLQTWLIGSGIIEASEAIDETEQMLFDEAI